MKDVELYVRYTAMIVALIVARRAPALSSMAGLFSPRVETGQYLLTVTVQCVICVQVGSHETWGLAAGNLSQRWSPTVDRVSVVVVCDVAPRAEGPGHSTHHPMVELVAESRLECTRRGAPRGGKNS